MKTNSIDGCGKCTRVTERYILREITRFPVQDITGYGTKMLIIASWFSLNSGLK
jgi:hypothetical protein